jgi:hypothetical protein
LLIATCILANCQLTQTAAEAEPCMGDRGACSLCSIPPDRPSYSSGHIFYASISLACTRVGSQS